MEYLNYFLVLGFCVSVVILFKVLRVSPRKDRKKSLKSVWGGIQKRFFSRNSFIRNIAKYFSFAVFKEDKGRCLITKGMYKNQQVIVEYDEKTSEAVLTVKPEKNIRKPFVISRAQGLVRGSIIIGDTGFDQRFIVRGSDDLFAVFLSSSLRRSISMIAEGSSRLQFDNNELQLAFHKDLLASRPIQDWIQKILALVRIAEELHAPVNDVFKTIEREYRQQTDISVKLQCLRWLLKNAVDSEDGKSFLLKGLESGDAETIETALRVMKEKKLVSDKLLSEKLEKLVFFPHIRVWSKAVDLLGERSIQILNAELNRMRSSLQWRIDEYRHVFSVLNKMDRIGYWQELEKDLNRERLPDDISVYIITEMQKARKTQYLPAIKEFIRRHAGGAVNTAIEMIGSCGTVADIEFLHKEQQTAYGDLKQTLQRAISAIQHRYGKRGDGWLSMSDSTDSAGALSLTKQTDGALSFSEDKKDT